MAYASTKGKTAPDPNTMTEEDEMPSFFSSSSESDTDSNECSSDSDALIVSSASVNKKPTNPSNTTSPHLSDSDETLSTTNLFVDKPTTDTSTPSASSSTPQSNTTPVLESTSSNTTLVESNTTPLESSTHSSSTPTFTNRSKQVATHVIHSLREHPFVHNTSQLYRQMEKYLDDQFAQYPLVQKIEQTTHVRVVHIFLVLVLIGFLFVLFDWAPQFITTALGFCYPAFKSFQRLTKNNEIDPDTGQPLIKDHKHWLVYWVIYALLNLCEYFHNALLYVFPSYWLAKYLFILYTTLPFTGGARVVYEQIVKRVIQLHRFCTQKREIENLQQN